MNREIWKTIEEFPDYEISNLGKVKSLKFKKEKILTPGRNRYGYLYVILYKNVNKDNKTVHRLVLETFEPIEDMDKFECNHIDGNKENNKYPENIEWCVHSENIKHAVENGLIKKGQNHPMFGKKRPKHSERMKGENHPGSILTEKDIIKIKIDLKEGILNQREIGEKFGVSRRTISHIKKGDRWSHIKIGGENE